MLGGFEAIFSGLFFLVLDISSVVFLASLVDFEGLNGSELFEVVIEDLLIKVIMDIFDENVGERVSFDLLFVLWDSDFGIFNFLSIKFLDNLFSKIGFIVGVIEVDIGESFFFDILILEKTDSCNLDMTGEKL